MLLLLFDNCMRIVNHVNFTVLRHLLSQALLLHICHFVSPEKYKIAEYDMDTLVSQTLE